MKAVRRSELHHPERKARHGNTTRIVRALCCACIIHAAMPVVAAEVLLFDNLETTDGPTTRLWSPHLSDEFVAIVRADCPNGGNWALRLTSSRKYMVAFRPVDGVQNGDQLELSAWVRQDVGAAGGLGKISLQTWHSDVIAEQKHAGGEYGGATWQRIAITETVRCAPQDSVRVVLTANGPKGSAILFDLIEVRRLKRQ